MSSLTYLILNYNRAHYVKECISSIFAIKESNDIVLVIDDCSKDNSVEIINMLLSNYKFKFIAHEINLGMYQSIRETLSLVQTDFITIVDSDDLINVSLSPLICKGEYVRYMFKLIHGNTIEDSSKTYPHVDYNLDTNTSAFGSLLKHGHYVGSTTTGNVYDVSVLKKLTEGFNFPKSTSYFDTPSFDGFIHRKIAFEGKVTSRDLVVGLYRRHESNYGSVFSIYTHKKVKRSLKTICTDIQYVSDKYAINPWSFKVLLFRDKRILIMYILGHLLKGRIFAYFKGILLYILLNFSIKDFYGIFNAHRIFLTSFFRR